MFELLLALISTGGSAFIGYWVGRMHGADLVLRKLERAVDPGIPGHQSDPGDGRHSDQ